MSNDYSDHIFIREEIALPLDEWERIRDLLPIGSISRDKINNLLVLHNRLSPATVLKSAVVHHLRGTTFRGFFIADAEWILSDLRQQGWELRKIDDTET